jgi:hypothetical protein
VIHVKQACQISLFASSWAVASRCYDLGDAVPSSTAIPGVLAACPHGQHLSANWLHIFGRGILDSCPPNLSWSTWYINSLNRLSTIHSESRPLLPPRYRVQCVASLALPNYHITKGRSTALLPTNFPLGFRCRMHRPEQTAVELARNATCPFEGSARNTMPFLTNLAIIIYHFLMTHQYPFGELCEPRILHESNDLTASKPAQQMREDELKWSWGIQSASGNLETLISSKGKSGVCRHDVRSTLSR